MEKIARGRGMLMGLAVGDAVGTTVEFKPRGTFKQVTDMQGGGPFSLKPGQWTDDTSMALCLAESLLHCGKFDPHDQMQRYTRWWRHGYLSSTGTCFDIGTTVRSALSRYQKTGDPFSGSSDPYSAGNGCIMRLAPVPLFYHRHPDWLIHFCAQSSRTTHGASECLDASRLFGAMLYEALQGKPKRAIMLDTHSAGALSPKVEAIARAEYVDKHESEIRGSGYVVESLEAALWCFHQTETFQDAILTAVNLGDDTDTTAAVVGQLAGAYYGEHAIPAKWKNLLLWRERIGRTAEALMQADPTPQRHLA